MARYVSTDLNTMQVKLDDSATYLSICDIFVPMFYDALGSGFFGYRAASPEIAPGCREVLIARYKILQLLSVS